MRTSLIFVMIACLALAQASLFLPHAQNFGLGSNGDLMPTINGTKADVDSYFNGIWGYYNLQQKDASKCFDDVTAAVYFQYLQAGYLLGQAFSQPNQTATRNYFAQWTALNASLYLTLQCVQNSKDYETLMETLHVNTFNKSWTNFLTDLYYYAHLPDWYLAYTPVYLLLQKSQYYTAGYSYGGVVTAIANNATDHTIMFELFKAFENGMFYWVNIAAPYNLSSCYNDTGASYEVRFHWGWAESVANTTVANASNATQAWFEGEGGQLLNMTQPIHQCENTTQDWQRFEGAVGMDPRSPEWRQAMFNYISNPQYAQNYWDTMNAETLCWHQYNPSCAGIAHGQFYLNVAATINKTSTDIEF